MTTNKESIGIVKIYKILTLITVMIVISIACLKASISAAQDITSSEKIESKKSKLLITNVNILTMASKKSRMLKNHSILIVGNKIVKIAPSSKFENIKDSTIVEGKGQFLLPGLIDAHVHLWDEAELSAYLAFGVTTIRNASGIPFHLDFQKTIEAERMTGPRIITTGPILNGQGPNTQVNHQIIHNASDARAAVRQQYAQGYRHLKVYSNLSREAYETVLSESKHLGMTLMGHTPEGTREPGIPYQKPFLIDFRELLDDNFVSIEHMETIVWHGLYDTLDEIKIRKLAKDIANSNTAVTPTLLSHHNLVLVARSQGKYLKRPGTELLNPFVSAFERESYEYWSNQPPTARDTYDDFYLRATKIFQEEGVTLLAGTDAGIFTNIPGLSLIEELKLMVKAGLTPYQALKTATTNPAKVLGLANQVGKIKPGYIADLLLVRSNPIDDISVLQSPSGLVVRGKWYDAKSISMLKQQATMTSYERTEKRIHEGLAAQGASLSNNSP